ncbi:MAG: PAS domain-containing protein, partial [Burkholderiaceae bacterium]|nr:PAS domain-containing protein [Burkholderiaceae bacterium]
MSELSSDQFPVRRALAVAAAQPAGPAQDALEVLSSVVAAIELTPMVAVRSVDRGGIVCFWNRTCAELYGIAAGDALGQPLASLVAHALMLVAQLDEAFDADEIGYGFYENL